MATALLYNLEGKEKFSRIRMVLMRLGIRGQIVAQEDYERAIGSLLGQDTPVAQEQGEMFSEEMMVLSNLSPIQFNGLLQELRENRCGVALKAVVTEHNVAWSSTYLHKEIAAEHEMMAKLRDEEAQKGGIHKKQKNRA